MHVDCDAQNHERTIKIYLQEVGSVGMNWIDLAQEMDSCPAIVYAMMNLHVP
jgi:GTP cyclohydrolase FolE2